MCVDHKPLLGILGDKKLEEIENPRIRRLKEKTFCWRFRTIYIQGEEMAGADAISRRKRGALESGQEEAGLGPDLGSRDLEGDRPEARKQRRENLFMALNRAAEPEQVRPDSPLDGTDAVLCSLEAGVKAVTWERVKEEAALDTTSRHLVQWIDKGLDGQLAELPGHLHPYWKVREKLTKRDGVPMMEDRIIIPARLRQEVMETLHSAHQGVTSMALRAAQIVYWPGFWSDIEQARRGCRTCDKMAPSQPNLPPVQDEEKIEYPFQHICMDHMTLNNSTYGVYVDRYSGWPGIYQGDAGEDVIDILSTICETYGVPETVTTDGGKNYTSKKVEQFLKDFGIRHRVSSVANPHANTRAELGVKTVKRLLKDNLTNTGTVDKRKLNRALLQYRNTPDRDTGFSPAMALFGRQLRDFMPQGPGFLKESKWKEVLHHREQTLAVRNSKDNRKWNEHTKHPGDLEVGTAVDIQNQLGNHKRRWDKRGVVVQVKGHDQYEVRVDGSRQLTKRNRKFLRPFKPVTPGQGRVTAEEWIAGGFEEPPQQQPRQQQGPPTPEPAQATAEGQEEQAGEDQQPQLPASEEEHQPEPENAQVQGPRKSGREKKPPAWQTTGEYVLGGIVGREDKKACAKRQATRRPTGAKNGTSDLPPGGPCWESSHST